MYEFTGFGSEGYIECKPYGCNLNERKIMISYLGSQNVQRSKF